MSKFRPRSSISGKIAIVTGASSGIGQATARLLGLSGATVVLAARREERLKALEEEIFNAGGIALAVPTDLTIPDQITRLVDLTLANYGRIDILANIAGWGAYEWFEELSQKELRMQYEVNVLGLAELTRQVLPVMKGQRSGHIINMSSYASRVAVPPMTVYASTKYAIEGLSDGLRRELLPWGIHVTRIHPSGVSGTEFNKKAGSGDNVTFRSLPIGKVSRETVAKKIMSTIERPRRAVFVSRLYDPAVFLNRRLPGVLDSLMSFWVQLKRPELRGSAQFQQKLTRMGAGLAGFTVGAMALSLTLKSRRGRR